MHPLGKGGRSVSSHPKFPLERCPECGGLWFGGQVHAPHFNVRRELVDCVGRPLPRRAP